MVESYDSLIRRAVPRYDEIIERLIAYLPPRANRVLELGCGTGNLTLALSARYSTASLTLVDASPEMLSVTRQRLGREARLVESRFEDLPADLGTFDVVVANIVAATLQSIAHDLRARLVPGGTLVLAGIIAEKEAATLAAFRLGVTARDQRDDWVSLVLR